MGKKGEVKIENKSLYIPQGIKLRPEIFTGFGSRELKQALVMCSVIGAGILLYFFCTGNVTVTIVAVLSGIAASVMFTMRDVHNISVINQIKYMLHFAVSPKYYPYRNGLYKEVRSEKKESGAW